MIERRTAGQVVRDTIDVLRSRRDLAQSLTYILAAARALLAAREAYLLTVESDQLRLRAVDGGRLGVPLGTRIALERAAEGQAVSSGTPLVLRDAQVEPRFRDWLDRPGPVGAMVAVPVLHSGKVTAVLGVARLRPGLFAGADLWWLEVLAALAGLALEDDRIYRAQERRARQAEALTELSSQSEYSLDGILEVLNRTLSRALGASYVDLLVPAADESALVSRRCAALGAGAALRVPLAEGEQLADVYLRRRPLLCQNLEPEQCRYYGERSPEAIIAVPVVAAARVRAVLYLEHDERLAFTGDDLAFAEIVAGRLGTIWEREELRTAQLHLQKLEAEAQARDEFVAIASHELKTPVAVIQAYTELLNRRAEKAGDQSNSDVLRRIGEQAERMLELIDGLLDLQRLEGGPLSLEFSRFDLVSQSRQVVDNAQATTQQHRLSLEAPAPVWVTADRRRVEQVLQNLLDNAIKFSPDGGRISVDVREGRGEHRGKAVVAVADQGIGIAAEEQPLVFEKYRQGGERLQRGHVGLGLGLYISRQIVHQHGGEMWLQSQPGEGATVFFSLPLAAPDADDQYRTFS